MHAIEFNAAIQFQRGPKCDVCNGTGRVEIVGRERTFRTGTPDVAKGKCPACLGKGHSGLSVKG